MVCGPRHPALRAGFGSTKIFTITINSQLFKMAKKLSQKAVVVELTTIGMFAGGVVGGNIIGNMAEKVVNKEGAAGTLPKRLIVPLALALVGAVASLKMSDKKVKLLAAGVGAAGVLRTAKAVMPNNVYLQGTDDEQVGSTESYSEGWAPMSGIETYATLPAINGFGEGVNRNYYNQPALDVAGFGSVSDADVIL